MPTSDPDRAQRLDRAFDGVLRGDEAADQLDDFELTAVVRHMHELASRPAPEPSFVHRLKEELVAGSPAAVGFVGLAAVPLRSPHVNTQPLPPRADAPLRPLPRRWWQRPEIAAVILVCAVLAGYFAVADQVRHGAEPPQFAGVEIPPAAISSEPVRLKINAIGVDASIERRSSKVEPILIPAASGPWVVAWWDHTAAPGEGSNVVLDGHLDYWPDAPAVFWDLKDLIEGDRIDVVGANRTVFSYTVEWLRHYPLATASKEQQLEILGPTFSESVTLITAAGEFDRSTGLYPEVLVVRALFDSVSSLATLAVPDPAECRTGPRPVHRLEALAAAVIAGRLATPNPTDLSTLESQPASPEIVTAITAVVQQVLACINADDFRRQSALYTDDGLARFFADTGDLVGYEWAPTFSGLATPRPAPDRVALLAVENVRVLPDGRVAAEVTVGPADSSSGLEGSTGESHVLILKVASSSVVPVENGNDFEVVNTIYLIDEVIDLPPGTPTP